HHPRRGRGRRFASRAGAGSGGYPTRGRLFGHRCGQGHPAQVRCSGHLHHRLPGAAADRGTARAYLPDHQALPAGNGEGGDQPGAVLPSLAPEGGRLIHGGAPDAFSGAPLLRSPFLLAEDQAAGEASTGGGAASGPALRAVRSASTTGGGSGVMLASSEVRRRPALLTAHMPSSNTAAAPADTISSIRMRRPPRPWRT